MKPCSGKFVLRLPPEVHLELRRQAQALGCSLNSLCSNYLERAVSKKNVRNVHPQAGQLEDALTVIHKHFPHSVQAIVLFGSAARGERRRESDIDLLLVLGTDTPIHRSTYQVWEEQVEPKLPLSFKNISPHFVHLSANPLSAGSLWYEVAIDGNILYSEDNRVHSFLAEIRSLAARGIISRGCSHGQNYWIRHGDS